MHLNGCNRQTRQEFARRRQEIGQVAIYYTEAGTIIGDERNASRCRTTFSALARPQTAETIPKYAA